MNQILTTAVSRWAVAELVGGGAAFFTGPAGPGDGSAFERRLDRERKAR